MMGPVHDDPAMEQPVDMDVKLATVPVRVAESMLQDLCTKFLAGRLRMLRWAVLQAVLWLHCHTAPEAAA